VQPDVVGKQHAFDGYSTSDVANMQNRKILAGRVAKIRHILLALNLLAPDAKYRKQLDEYRKIKRPLLMNAFGKVSVREQNANLVMVTSAHSGEGKTYTTINLAISIAMERDTTVMIIDCDDAKSSLTTTLGVDNSVGLTDYLQGNINDLREIIIKTDIPNLVIIPTGKRDIYSTELFASDRMESLLLELAKRYKDRIVLLDSPPLMETTQTRVLAEHIGQLLLVVEEGNTPQKTIIEAISLLDSKKIIGTILNKRRYAGDREAYGGYYGMSDEK
jgi:exopolysaccharide/PEP-CTERM locus tyrosine autokinase